ncbi:hypothetical protein D3C71_1553000 [compost metagenome]
MRRPGNDLGRRDQQGGLQHVPAGVFRRCGLLAAVDRKINLVHAGIQRDNNGVCRCSLGHLGGDGLMGHHGHHGNTQPQPHSLRHPASHAQAGKAARTLPKRHGVQRAGGQTGLGQQFARHRQEPFRVLLRPFVLAGHDLQAAIDHAQKGHPTTGRRRFQSQQV